MRLALLIGLGGAVGSVLRHWVGGMVHGRAGPPGLPVGTLAVNVAGCLAIGMVTSLVEARGAASPETRAFVMVGLLGGFTTFSAFGNETLSLMQEGEPLLAGGNVAANVILGLAAVWLGRAVVPAIWG